MKVVIYGGSGFIGSWITKFLLNNNFQITIFDNKIKVSSSSLGSEASIKKFIGVSSKVSIFKLFAIG